MWPAQTSGSADQSPGADVSKTTGEGGEFTFDFLQVGTYQLKIERAGFKSIQSSGIELSAGQNVRRNFALELGAITETVSVEAAAPLVNAVSAEQRQNVSTVEASQLPLSKRNIGGILCPGHRSECWRRFCPAERRRQGGNSVYRRWYERNR